MTSPAPTASATWRIRGVVLGFLAALLVARSFDAFDHPDEKYVPGVVVLFALPFWYASGIARERFLRLRWPLLTAQAVLTFAPFALFGSQWVGGVTGLLGGLVLLVAPRRWSWWLLGAVLVAEMAVRAVVGWPYPSVVSAAVWVAVAFTDVALAMFGLASLADMVERLDATRSDLADAAVALQRTRSADRLRSAVGERLDAALRHAALAVGLVGRDVAGARAELDATAELSRQAAGAARKVAAESPVAVVEGGIGTADRVLVPRLARGILLVEMVLFGTQNTSNALDPWPPVVASPPLVGTVVAATVAIIGLQLRHSAAAQSGPRPTWWPATLGAQAVLTYAMFALVGPGCLVMLPFLAGSVLLLLRGWLRSVAVVAVIASLPLLVWAWSAAGREGGSARWAAYATAVAVAWGLMVYGLSRLAGVAVQLAKMRAELAALAAAQERTRLSRDTHDLLGLGLSAMALKSDLAAALLERDPGRARAEVGQLLRIGVAVRLDAHSVSGGELQLSFAGELQVAADVLASAGVELDTSRATPADLPAESDVVLATVLREAVTNVLRHSTARRGSVTLGRDDGVVTLAVCNDGAIARPIGAPPGRGLHNLRERLAAVGGTLVSGAEAGAGPGEFVLRAEVPLS